ncbi:hypothetical protein ONS95_001540 [Cadophora gregata]|uniref:uncharacterized protein n=1 Tax=Cadophora gregata TaxID=51156 RepID=UPI0026DB3AD0|nr:uncharacterized protein ONS95_001540 [Cadophora gregata]KAK0111163.1 hypothetical protein ONS95_001540 [Cadophora gregata]KAK0112369.1 hypothetical protein ONS96_001612 [Cadophora gregata f. sp. sojae]
MSLSIAQWPSQPIPEPVKDLISKFYACVDAPQDPNANTVLANEVFLPNGTFTINQRVVQGKEQIQNWRASAASGNQVKVSVHTVEKVYNLDGQGGQVLTTGTLFLEMMGGQKATSVYAARCLVYDVGSANPRIKEWQGWCDYMPYMLAGMFEAPRIYNNKITS